MTSDFMEAEKHAPMSSLLCHCPERSNAENNPQAGDEGGRDTEPQPGASAKALRTFKQLLLPCPGIFESWTRRVPSERFTAEALEDDELRGVPILDCQRGGAEGFSCATLRLPAL